MKQKITLVVPVYNEAQDIRENTHNSPASRI